MTNVIEQRALQRLESISKRSKALEIDRFETAICWTCLDDYSQARQYFHMVLAEFLATPEMSFWYRSNQPDWLADVAIMAREAEKVHDADRALRAWQSVRRKRSLWGLYAFSIVALANREDSEARYYATEMLMKPGIKAVFAAGKAIHSIVECDQTMFDARLGDLLLAHHGMVKFGDLRWAANGFLCLPAMSLGSLAMDRGMMVNAESDYLNRGYLDYLHLGPAA